MKKVIIAVAIVLVAGFILFMNRDKPTFECDYKVIEVILWENGLENPTVHETFRGCFKRNVRDMGLVMIEDSSKTVRVSYYIESNKDVVNIMNLTLGENEPMRFRKKEGDDLFIKTSGADLSFVFGDTEKRNIKGTVNLYFLDKPSS